MSCHPCPLPCWTRRVILQQLNHEVTKIMLMWPCYLSVTGENFITSWKQTKKPTATLYLFFFPPANMLTLVRQHSSTLVNKWYNGYRRSYSQLFRLGTSKLEQQWRRHCLFHLLHLAKAKCGHWHLHSPQFRAGRLVLPCSYLAFLFDQLWH